MAEEGNAEIYVLDLESRKTKRLTFNTATETAPSWSPTGREIAFTTDRLGSGTPQIYIMDAEGSNVRKASFGGNYHDAPAWAPTSERIAFVSRVDNTLRHLHPQPPDQPDLEAAREQRPQRIAELVARRPPPRLRLQHEGRTRFEPSTSTAHLRPDRKGENKLANWTT